MSPCSGCMKVRRAIVNVAPKRFAPPFARLLLPPVASAADVVRLARSWIGVPFRHQGRDRSGIDCWGVPVVILRDLRTLPDGFDERAYPRQPVSGQVDERITRFCTPLPEAVPGCLIALRLQRTITHVAIYTDADTLIHAMERGERGGVVEHGFRGLWRTRYAQGAWALPGVSYG